MGVTTVTLSGKRPLPQTRLLALAGPAGPQALALNSSAVYVGVAGGGAVGGPVLESRGSGLLPLAAAVVELVALALFWAAANKARSKESPPLHAGG
ncbi:hypothetical protein [Nonomuraea sp. NPDC005650]|uniref:hypothetical protein n=1 Tax=Nonomuraea sp. NPDC005650 TaxID=3157045 RepID=UPI0033A32011